VLKRAVEFNDLVVTSTLSHICPKLKNVLMKESIHILYRLLFLKLICKVNIALLAMHLLQTTIDTKNYLYYWPKKFVNTSNLQIMIHHVNS